ncbi:hypothetical protein BASA60_001969 [Batrachochytrium salamandrivorans]|nr:hypothetical protein BASA60_001969 [Batrachochytrium salamandrivorans]
MVNLYRPLVDHVCHVSLDFWGSLFNQPNEYDGLTLWEQIDGGAQFTPTKKYLTAVPIILFLLSTHYTHYDFPTFMVNLTSLVIVW